MSCRIPSADRSTRLRLCSRKNSCVAFESRTASTSAWIFLTTLPGIRLDRTDRTMQTSKIPAPAWEIVGSSGRVGARLSPAAAMMRDLARPFVLLDGRQINKHHRDIAGQEISHRRSGAAVRDMTNVDAARRLRSSILRCAICSASGGAIAESAPGFDLAYAISSFTPLERQSVVHHQHRRDAAKHHDRREILRRVGEPFSRIRIGREGRVGVTSKVWPSGVDRSTATALTAVLPPGRLSTITGWLSAQRGIGYQSCDEVVHAARWRRNDKAHWGSGKALPKAGARSRHKARHRGNHHLPLPELSSWHVSSKVLR